MPVRLEAITQPSEQDLIDLEKIYQDFPAAIESAEVLRQSDAEHVLFAGRFNDRLLGAMQVVFQQSCAEIRFLCVREITRRRHVARDMLRLLLAQHPGQKFVVKNEQDNQALEGLMRLMQFVKTPEGYCYINA